MGTKILNDQETGQEEEAKEDQDVEETPDGEETPEDTSASDNTDGESEEESTEEVEEFEEEDVDDDNSDEIAGLESQRDRLSKEIVELRRERRAVKQQEPKTKPDVFVENTDLGDIAESDIALIERVVKAKGYVKAEDNYKSQMDSYKDQWLEKHPEYLPENDPDDVLWGKLNQELNTFYKAPKDPKAIVKILNKIDKDINPKASIPVKSRATTNAAKQKLKTSGKGGGSKGKTAPSPKSKNVDRSALQGFTDEELSEMGL